MTHVFDWSKGIVKRVLPYFDSIIPFYFAQLKMIFKKSLHLRAKYLFAMIVATV